MATVKSPILETLGKAIRHILGKGAPSSGGGQSRFRSKYVSFQELLESNAELLRVITAIEEKLPGRHVFGMAFLQSAASQGVFHALRMVRGFENLSGTPQPVLRERIEIIRDGIRASLSVGAVSDGPWFKDVSELSLVDSDLVGGKCANLGESRNRAGLPVPNGFAITTAAYRAFLGQSDLASEIAKRTMSLDPDDAASIQEASEDIQRLMLLAPFPDGFEQELYRRHAGLAASLQISPEEPRVAMRSSAVGEDGELSFAGQYLSVLGVPLAKVAESYRYVAASLYTPRAMAYRLQKGVPDEAAAMGVACLAMVPSRASGVMYTRHPFDPADGNILINAVWGLGPYAVDGVVSPDRYVVDKSGLNVVARDVAEKPVQLSCNPAGGVAESGVDAGLATQACLHDKQIQELARWGVLLEAHYGAPQDVEWALDQTGALVLLQSRPLALPSGLGLAPGQAAPPVPGHEVLLSGGEAAYPGVGCGEVHLVGRDDDLAGFPDGGVLVAGHSSPKFMVVMARASAIVTEHGSVTGHMASLAREFGVPSLLGLENATGALRQGQLVTVDAGRGHVYAGSVPELLSAGDAPKAPMLGTPIHGLLLGVNALVCPLNLIDPKTPEFSPGHCRTLHDITRYLHEKSYSEMFTLGDQASGEGGMAVRLDVGIGLDLHVIDLGGGLREAVPGASRVQLEEVVSRPFKALMRGLADDRFVAKGPRPVHLRGFLSVMGRQMVDGASMSAERFGDKSYAMISDKYLNFSSRVGYHYGVLDCYCGGTVSKNYITFAFKGGAAGEDRRERRARAIALILERLGFEVGVNADRVQGRFQKYPAQIIEERLAQLGRLLQYTRQTDMLMTSEQAVTAMAESFLRGETVFGMPGTNG